MTCEKSEQNEMLLQKINQQKTKLNQIICELSLWKVLIDQKKKKNSDNSELYAQGRLSVGETPLK